MATMVIRVWDEPAQGDAFRARLTYGAVGAMEESIVTADAEEVLELVRAWLAACGGMQAGDELGGVG
ncbi:hypothetical protein ACFWN7_12145 [Agromyces sp. NPDC058484]|uniref:hypothetical protein n=1 Tax=Agromyces sp. NPDC058484 TaxID=3346524 RepID=UPI00365B4EFB